MKRASTIRVSYLIDANEAARLLNKSEKEFMSIASENSFNFWLLNGIMYFSENDLWKWMFNQNPSEIGMQSALASKNLYNGGLI